MQLYHNASLAFDPQRPPTPIEVIEVKQLQGAGNLRAFLTIRVGGLTLHGCRIIKQGSQRAYMAFPQVQDQAGRWWPAATCSERLAARIKAAALTAWEAQQS